MKIIIFALFIAILLESTLVTIPISLLIIIFASIVIRKNEVFAMAFLAGLFLDILAIRDIGWSSAFFVTLVLIILLYQKKFEIESLHFVAITAFIGTFIYLLGVGVSYVFLQTIISTTIISASFLIFQKTNKKFLKYA